MKIYLNVPYKEKDLAKAKGAQWDPDKKRWFINCQEPMEEFQRWSYSNYLDHRNLMRTKYEILEEEIKNYAKKIAELKAEQRANDSSLKYFTEEEKIAFQRKNEQKKEANAFLKKHPEFREKRLH